MEFTTAQVAEIWNVSTRTVHQWAKSEGLPVTRGVGRAGNSYPAREVIQWWVRRQMRAHSEDGVLDYTAERARLTYHQANIAEMEAEQKRGQLWPVETVQLLMSQMIGRARSRLLLIPGKMRNRRPELDGAAHDLLEELVREALEELGGEQLPGAVRASLEQYHAHLAAASEADAEPVGDAPRRDH